MRVQKTFSIKGHDDKQFKVKELTVEEILSILDVDRLAKGEWKDYFTFFQHNILERATNISPKQLLKMTPSDLKVVWEQFKEANAAFFELSAAVGIQDMIAQLKPAICGAFGSYAVDSLQAAMSMPRSTDSATSLTPSTSFKSSNSNDSPPQPTPPESEPMRTKTNGKSSSEAAA